MLSINKIMCHVSQYKTNNNIKGSIKSKNPAPEVEEMKRFFGVNMNDLSKAAKEIKPKPLERSHPLTCSVSAHQRELFIKPGKTDGCN